MQAGLAQAGPAQPRLTPIPAQLPADAAIVVGRRSQLATLDKIHTEAAKRLVVLHGCGGVGKTTLAVHWAHGVAHEFPDGQLYLDLRGYGNERPLPPAEALSFFVRALGAAADQVPVTERELGALYRSLLATRRMLVILDNAGTAQAVRPLLPGSASCMVIVTSRGPLLGLQALDDACAVPVGPLSSAESVKLLARMTDANGTGLGRGQLREMATLSAHMPLALRIAAANCAGRTREQAAEFLLAMRADRFGRLRIDGEATSVRAAFETSYATLPPATQDLFRLVGSAPVRDISLPAAAALLARPSTEAAPGLAQLVHVGLADQRPGDRFRMHDLLRCYALELTGDRHDEEAMRRLLSFYHHTTIAAVAAAVQGVTRLEHDAAHPDVQPLSFDDAQSAATWLRTELTNLVAACGAAADCPPYRIAWQLADALRDYFWIHRCGPQWLAVADKALLASRNAGDVPAQAACHNNLGVADWCFARYDEATAHFRRAIELGRQSGDNQTVAAGLANLGGVYRETGDPDAGAASCGQALDLYERLTQTAGAANTRITLSGIGIDTGKFADAMAHAEHAIRQYRTLGRMDGQGSALLLISEAQCLTGRFELAMLAAREALTLFRALGTRQGEACALLAQASAHVAANQPDAAEPLAQAALAIGVDTGSPQLQAEASACLADVKLYRGAPLEAAQAYASAASLAQQIRLRVVEVKALTGQARALCNLHDFQAAEIHAARAARLAKDNGYLFHAANAVNVLRLAENRYSSV